MLELAFQQRCALREIQRHPLPTPIRTPNPFPSGYGTTDSASQPDDKQKLVFILPRLTLSLTTGLRVTDLNKH